MGAKISVDSATLMNKGLELIEAYHLFGMAPPGLQAIVHPQSVVHSLVEFCDGSVMAQLGPADMRVPIAYTLAWPGRMPTPCVSLDLVALARLEFEAPDLARFPALKLAEEALMKGGAAPAILNAANEIAVASFLARQIGFLDIAALVGDVLAAYDPPPPATIDDVLAVDAEARAQAVRRQGKYRL
jgi:1-deoxy-D-xylulose-5-phosphate reductoisomerase